ncbi:flagellar type III secretion system pore protein FliP [Egicoccus sp. AB-alg6-2]|uniref:flagellar type III secretion system pore protein FliP n=1 Tax=Egicoccus sp. AB-alg6-2 TaxID=3242692 RepID=UPI00359DB203
MQRSAASRPRRLRRGVRLLPLLLLVGLLLATSAVPALAQVADPAPPSAPVTPDELADTGGIEDASSLTVTLDDAESGLSRTVTLVLLLSVAAMAPILLLLMTTFTRFIIVLSLIRNGLGLQTVPPAQVLLGLAVFLTLFAMGPTFSEVNETALQPMLAGEMDAMEAATVGYEPFRDFMLAQTRESDLRMFTEMAGKEAPANVSEVGPTTLIPAFVISELRTAFTIGFVIFVPFLIVDLVVAAVLMSLGMVMLPPVFVSMPLKLLLFVLVDGWALIARSLVSSVMGG